MKSVFITQTSDVGIKCYQWAQSITSNEFKLVEKMEESEIIFSVFHNEIFNHHILANKIAVNFHAGLLPEYRGSGTINWAIINGETETFVTAHLIEGRLDSGPIIESIKLDIGPSETAGTLYKKMEYVVFELFKDMFYRVLDGRYDAIPQSNSGARLYLRSELHLAKDLTRFVRAFTFDEKESAYYFTRSGKKCTFLMKIENTSFPATSKGQPLLSFCIPTYNRPIELQRLLSQVIPQLQKHKNKVELVIKDDSDSNDCNFAESLFCESGLKGAYYKGSREGLDKANIFLATHAQGEFIWWCGDDEEIIDGAIQKVLEILTNESIDFIFVNYILHGSKIASNQNINRLVDANELIQIAKTNITLLSTGVFRRSLGLTGIDLARKYIGTAFASQPIIFKAIVGSASNKRIYFLGHPYLINHPTVLTEGGLFYDGVNAFGVTYFKLINEFSPPLSRTVVNEFLKNNFGHIWRGLVIDWVRRNIPAPRNRLWDLRMYAKFPEYWLACIIFLMPKFLVKDLLYIYKIFNKKHYKQV